MLHHKATTRFILKRLTDVIELLFSIRQGDPLAMILYILYMEPFLVALEAELTGYTLGEQNQIGKFQQKIEAFCDDVNAVTNDLNDFYIIDEVVSKFEICSGAILSRNMKCKVVGFGAWRDKQVWPIRWIRAVREVKMFGIYICNSYREIIRLNWEHRYVKFSETVYSWKSRFLESLSQRVEVLRIFALSRVFYVAAILPIRKTMVKRFETLMGKFLWNFSGKVLRVSLEDLKNTKMAGGLNLPCLSKMSESLLVSQCIKLIRSGYKRSKCHLDYWLGDLTGSLSHNIEAETVAHLTPSYFECIGILLADLMVADILNSRTLLTITNKSIYRSFLADLPLPKVVRDSGRDYSRVWVNLHSKVVDSKSRDLLFLLLHNKLPVPERLFRINLKADPYCEVCAGAEIADITHFFCTCLRTSELWTWLKKKVSSWTTPTLGNLPDFDVLNLLIASNSHEKEIVWLVSNYVSFTWETIEGGVSVCLEKFFGFLTFKYREVTSDSYVKLQGLDEFR